MSDTGEFTREDFRAGMLDAITVMVNRNGGLHAGRYKNLRFRMFTMLCDVPADMSPRNMDKKADMMTLDDLHCIPDNLMIELFEYATYLSYQQR